jgi:hypothetical protein
VKDETCPFCGAERGALVGDSAVAAPRVSRGMLIAAAAAGAAVSLALTACSTAEYGCVPSPSCGQIDAGSGDADGGG